MKGVPFLSKWYGWTLGQSLPTKNFLDHPSSSRLGRECLKFNEHCLCCYTIQLIIASLILIHFFFIFIIFLNFCCVPFSYLGKIWVHLGIFKILELLISCKRTILQTDLQYIIQSKPFTTFTIACVGEGDCDTC